MLGFQPLPAADSTPRVELDPVALILNASGPVFVVIWLLIIASALVWVIAALKVLQLRRWAAAEQSFERELADAREPQAMFDAAARHPTAAGARVIDALAHRLSEPRVLGAAAKSALVGEQRRASTLMPTLASIGSASPFVGLLGTVYGIMDAFLRIGREKSASLPVVAPAIGEALIATAIGLFAAIPAVIAYNAIAKRMDDQLSALEAAADGWVELVMPAAEAAAAQEGEKRAQAEAAAQRLAEAMGPRFPTAGGEASTTPKRSDGSVFDERATQPRGKPSVPPAPLPKS